MSDKSWDAEQAQEYFLSAASRYFREVAKGAFLMGVSYQQLASALQSAMIEEGFDRSVELADEDGQDAANYSAIYAITGIPRANIQRHLRSSDKSAEGEKAKKPKNPVLSHVVKKWRTEFDSAPLPRGKGNDPQTLMGLINAVRVEQDLEKEVRGRGVFDALRLARMIYRSPTDPDKWELSEGAFKGAHNRKGEVQDGVSNDFHFLRENVGDHMAAAISNVLVSAKSSAEIHDQKMYDRSVGFTVSPKPETLRSLNSEIENRAFVFTNEVRKLIQQAEPNFPGPVKTRNAKFRYGAYFWSPAIVDDDDTNYT